MTATTIMIGFAIIIWGVCMVRFTMPIMNFTGRQWWLERYVGAGMTFTAYKFIGVLLVVLGVLVGTGFGYDILAFLFSPLRNAIRNVANGS